MFQRFTGITIPLYVALLVVLVLGGAGIFAAQYYRQTIENYDVYLESGGTGLKEFTYGSWPALQNKDFFKSVRGKLVLERASFIEADLANRRLTVFRNGEASLTVPILAAGKVGSWWETPAGLYKIEGREKNHFSSFAGVHLPWSLPFQGNFFIHGWPYYEGGTPVQSTYSGGCIRLSTEDAKTVYDLVTIGMPVLVYKQPAAQDKTEYAIKPPMVTATHYLAADLGSNFVFTTLRANEPAPIASLVKLITALTATEHINLDEQIKITPSMIVRTSKPRLWAGQTVRAFNLVYPLLLESSNEAALALARTVGEERFVSLMNSKAQALGLSATHLADPAGLSAENVSTAENLFALLQYMYTNQSFFLKITSGLANSELGNSPVFAGLENFNGFAGDPEFVGGKVGRTEAAQETIVSVFEIDTPIGKRPIGIVALGSKNAVRDAAQLIEYVKLLYIPHQ
jgi:hypothetical protein